MQKKKQNIGNRVQGLLNRRKSKNRLRKFAAVLSAAVVLSVTASLIKPAISVTEGEDVGIGNVPVAYSAESSSNDFKAWVTGITGDIDSTSDDPANKPLVGFKMEFEVAAGVLKADNNVFTYQLPSECLVNTAGQSFNIIDGSNAIAGSFTIDSSGLITITFDPTYISNKQADLDVSGMKGNIQFKAYVERDAENNGDVVIDFGKGDTTTPVTIDFADRGISVEKSGEVNTGTKSIDWQVTVKNPLNSNGTNANLNGCSVQDDKFKEIASSAITLTDENGDTLVENTNYTINHDSGTITFISENYAKKVVINYSTPVSDVVTESTDNQYESNKATFTPSVNTIPVDKATDTSNVTVPAGLDIAKSGTANYNDEKVTWTVTVTNTYGTDLSNYFVLDDAITLGTSIISEPAGAVSVSADGKLVFNEGCTATEIVITYSQPGDPSGDDSKMTNKASLKKEDPSTHDVTPVDETYNIEVEYKPYWASYKTGNYDSASKTITWTINVDRQADAPSLEGLVVTDDMFINATNIQVVQPYSTTAVPFTHTDGTNSITIGETVLQYIQITYTTAVDFASAEIDGEKQYINNVVGVSKNGVNYPGTSTRVEVTPKKEISKSCGNAEATDDPDIYKLKWTLTLQDDNGLKEKTVTDTLSANNSSEIIHYVNSNSNIVVKNMSDSYQAVDSNYYTIKYYIGVTEVSAGEKADSFKIVFSDACPDSLTKVQIEYYSFIDVADVAAGSSEIYKNKLVYPDVDPVEKSYTYEKIDTSNAPYKKLGGTNVDYNDFNSMDSLLAYLESEANDVVDLGSVKKLKIDGVEYYYFGWYIYVPNDSGLPWDAVYKDTLPTGFELVTNPAPVIILYNWDGSSSTTALSSYDGTNEWSTHYKVSTNESGNQVVEFKFIDNKLIKYEARIPVTDLIDKFNSSDEGAKLLQNTLVDVGNDGTSQYDPVVETQQLNEKAITKQLTPGSSGVLTYQVDVNPEGKCYTGQPDGMLLLTDNFYTTGYYDASGNFIALTDKAAVSVTLRSFEVIALDPYGNELGPVTSASYTIDTDPEAEGFTGYVPLTQSYDGGTFFQYMIVFSEPTDNPTVRIFGTPGASVTADTNNSVPGQYTSFAATINGDGYADVSLQMTAVETLSLWITGDVTGVSALTSQATKPYASQIQIEVPDATYLRIKYTYVCEAVNSALSQKYAVTNDVSVEGNSNIPTESKSGVTDCADVGSGEVYTTNYVRIEKVDVGNYAMKLAANFNLYKWDYTSGKWLAATGYTTGTDGISTPVWNTSEEDAGNLTTSSSIKTSDQFMLYMDKKTIYKLVEVKQPNGYYFDAGNPTTVYFALDDWEVTAESTFTMQDILNDINNNAGTTISADDVIVKPSQSPVQVTNYKKINLSVEKAWADGAYAHTNDSVTVQLYRSTKKTASGFPADSALTAIGDPVVLNESNSWTYTWGQDFDSGTAGGVAYYYYVKELSYTIDGAVYTVGADGNAYIPFYYGNSACSTSTIEIYNSNGLTIEKVWYDKNGKTLTLGDIPDNKITVEVYRSTIAPADAEGKDAEIYTDGNKIGTYDVNASDDWSKLITGLDPKDASGNTYYYYIKEISEFEDFNVIYYSNGSESNGIVTVANKSTKEVTEPEGVTLPETGGGGVAPIIAVGTAIAGTATVLLVTKRRKRAFENKNFI